MFELELNTDNQLVLKIKGEDTNQRWVSYIFLPIHLFGVYAQIHRFA